MGRYKEFSKSCKRCGVEWDKDFSNKYEGRALCLDCAKIAYEQYRKTYHNSLGEHTSKMEKMQPFKVENRQAHWTEVNKQLRGLKKLEDIRAFIKKQADEIFSNKELMEYINHQSLK